MKSIQVVLIVKQLRSALSVYHILSHMPVSILLAKFETHNDIVRIIYN